jgi:PAS domain S-box-containing protein
MSGSALAKLGGSEERFRLLLEAAPDAIVVTKQDGRIVLVNAQTERLFGYPREELLGQNVEVLLPQRVRHQYGKKRAAYFSRTKMRPMGTGLELYARRKDGTEFPVDVSFSPLETDGKTLVSGFIRDITERKRSEELVSHLAAIVETSDDAIIGRSLDGTILSWNLGAERLYGYKAEEVVGRPLALLVPPGQIDEMARFMKALRHGEHIEHYETTRLHKDGHPIEISVTISPVKDSADKVIGASVIARDITERKRAEEAPRQSLLEREGLIAKLQEALEEVKLLSGLLSICASCKKITNERGDWEPMESYLQTHSQAKFSHGMCPDCLRKLYPEQYRAWEQEVQGVTGTGHASDIREARLRDAGKK